MKQHDPASQPAAEHSPKKRRVHVRPQRASAKRSEAAPAHPQQEELIRIKAYSFYEARGGTDGHALDDWLQAKSLLEQPSSPSAKARKAPSGSA